MSGQVTLREAGNIALTKRISAATRLPLFVGVDVEWYLVDGQSPELWLTFLRKDGSDSLEAIRLPLDDSTPQTLVAKVKELFDIDLDAPVWAIRDLKPSDPH
jgi:hypothetical protein